MIEFSKENQEALEKLIMHLMSKQKIPGLAIAICSSEKILYKRGFGSRDLLKNRPMTTDTLTGIGSITKSFTAIAIMQLVEQGKISLDDPANKYLNFNFGKNSDTITIRHLLSHSSGIPALDGSIIPAFYLTGDFSRIIPLSSKEDFIWHLSHSESERIFSPGEKFFYNNDLFTCLGFIIENVSGMEYRDYMREKILKPLEMNRTTYTKSEFDNDPLKDGMTGYMTKVSVEEKPITTAPFPFSELLDAPGGILSSAEEMTHYLMMLLNQGNFDENTLLSTKSVNELWNPIIPCPYGINNDAKYCFGWIKENNFFGETLIHHGGGVGMSSGFLAIMPNLDLGVICVENDAKGLVKTAGLAALGLIMKKNIEILSEVIPQLKMEKIFNELCGNYETYRSLYKMTISPKNGTLSARIEIDDGEMEVSLAPINLSKLTFCIPSIIPANRNTLQFVRDRSSNKVIAVTFDRYLYHRIN
ncbi:MAG: serine hydrolase domain-containing protein [Promethearchaeota archaeon]